MSRNLIIDEAQIQQKIKRIAFEILEDNYDEGEIVIAGICKEDEGYSLATRLAGFLREIGDSKISLTSINLDKANPSGSAVELGVSAASVDGKVVVLVDDVANTGRTLLYAVKPLLEFSPKKIRIAVLVDRKHKAYPVSADYVGLSLATTMHEHITVELGAATEGVYLS